MSYPRYEDELQSWLEDNELEDTSENREDFEDEMINRAEEAEQRWLEYGATPTPPLDPWKAYMEEMR